MGKKILDSFYWYKSLLKHVSKLVRKTIRLFPIIEHKSGYVCEEIRKSVYRCHNNSNAKLVALYTIEDSFVRIEEMEYVDFLTHLKRYINTLAPPGCILMTVSSTGVLSPDSYLSKINSKLQMKLVELESDRTNTRLRSLVERLIEIRKRVLSGVMPVETSILTAIICDDARTYEDMLINIPQIAKHVLGISLKRVRDAGKALQIINFRWGKI